MVFASATGTKEGDGLLPVARMEIGEGLRQVVGFLIWEVLDAPRQEILECRRYRVEVPDDRIGQAVGIATELIDGSVTAGEAVALLAQYPVVDECKGRGGGGEGPVREDECLREGLLSEARVGAHGVGGLLRRCACRAASSAAPTCGSRRRR